MKGLLLTIGALAVALSLGVGLSQRAGGESRPAPA